jgi:hypothetical protein
MDTKSDRLAANPTRPRPALLLRPCRDANLPVAARPTGRRRSRVVAPDGLPGIAHRASGRLAHLVALDDPRRGQSDCVVVGVWRRDGPRHPVATTRSRQASPAKTPVGFPCRCRTPRRRSEPVRRIPRAHVAGWLGAHSTRQSRSSRGHPTLRGSAANGCGRGEDTRRRFEQLDTTVMVDLFSLF